MNGPGCVAITGLRTHLGQRLAERLLALPNGPKVVGLDLRRPLRLSEGLNFHRVDLTEPTAGGHLAEIFAAERVEAVVHLAFRREPTPDIDEDHELEAIGSLHLINAVIAASVPRLVVASTTMVYGPYSNNPNFLSEKHPLRGHPAAHCVMNRIEVERMLAELPERAPDVQVSVLRGCWVVGPTLGDQVARFFDRQTIPTVLGHDPLIQLLHEDDWLRAFEVATLEGRPGVYNVVGSGVLPLSTMIALAGKRALPLPAPILRRIAAVPSRSQSGDPPEGFLDYLRYLWVAEGERGFAAFGDPVYSTREAWTSFVTARRMRRYR